MAEQKKTVDVTSGIGTLSFPRVFPSTAGVKKKDGVTKVYDLQFLIPKTDREQARALLKAIAEVGQAKWGDNWKKVRTPLRDADKEKDELTDDGTTTKGEKYPERLGHWFINCRSEKPVAVVDRTRNIITDPEQIYAGVKAKVSINFYPYSVEGNHGVGAGLNGVQKIADGEPIGGGGKPAVESMFDLLDDDDLGLDDDADPLADEPEPAAKPAPAKKAAAKKAPAKKAAPKPAPEPEDDLSDLEGEGEVGVEDDLYADLDADL